jgi:hypothetical protein
MHPIARPGPDREDRAAAASARQRRTLMHKLVLMCGIGVLGGCAAAPGGTNAAANEAANEAMDEAANDAVNDVATGVASSNSFSYTPIAFARISDAGGGGAPSVLVGFDSVSASPITVAGGAGNYTVTLPGMGTIGNADATGGHVQLTAEGTGNARCRILSWLSPLLSSDLNVSVQCTTPAGALAASGFAVLYFRYNMPSPSTFATSAAYLWRPENGAPALHYDYNSSGTHNTFSGSNGSYSVLVPHASAVNASMMVSSYGGSAVAGPVCSIVSWSTVASPVPGVSAGIECRNTANQLVETAFTFSYSTTGPAQWQQGAHAWFNGSVASPMYSSALGKVEGCSAASVTGSGGTVVTMTVSGDLGSWDASPLLRASFASRYGAAGYCKVESLTTSGVAPSSTATTALRCYDATGAVVAAPRLTFTHATSDAAGPC